MKVSIRPVCGRILLQIFEEEEKEIGGIIVKAPERRDGFRKAKVRALPDGYNGDLHLGSEILMPPYGGCEVIINRERLVFIREAEIPAVIEHE